MSGKKYILAVSRPEYLSGWLELWFNHSEGDLEELREIQGQLYQCYATRLSMAQITEVKPLIESLLPYHKITIEET